MKTVALGEGTIVKIQSYQRMHDSALRVSGPLEQMEYDHEADGSFPEATVHSCLLDDLDPYQGHKKFEQKKVIYFCLETDCDCVSLLNVSSPFFVCVLVC